MQPRVCIYGTGAIGGLIAARLAKTDAHVTCIARGDTLAALRSNGLRLIENGQEIVANVVATDDVTALGTQDFVIVALKSHALKDNAENIATVLSPDSIVVTAQNGLPWWYFYEDKSGFPKHHLNSVDPGGEIWNALRPERAIGAVVYPAATMTQPGVVQHVSGNRFSIGEPSGSISTRLEMFAKLLESAGFDITPTENIRAEIWLKLAVNAAVNPLSLIHKATVGEILDSATLRSQLSNAIADGQRVAAQLGINAIMSPEQLLNALEVVREHKTSMLVDFEQGRTLEKDALIGAVIEIANELAISVDTLQALNADDNLQLSS